MSGNLASGTTTWRRRILPIVLITSGVILWLSTDERTQGLLATSGKLVAATVAVSVPWGTALALLVVRINVPGRRGIAVCLAGLLCIPLFVVATAWEAGFGIEGWIGWQPDGEWPRRLWVFWSAVWIHAMGAVPWVAVIVATGLAAVESELEEDALLDTGLFRVLLYVTLPRAATAIGLAAVWVTFTCFGQIAVTDLFQIRTFAEEVFVQATGGPLLQQLELPWAGTPAAETNLMTGTAVAIVLSGLALYFVLGIRERMQLFSWRSRPLILRRGRWAWSAVAWVAVLLLLAPPIMHLAVKAGSVLRPTPDGVLREWSFARLLTVVLSSPVEFSRELRATVFVAAAAATTSVSLAAAWGWLARGRRWAGAAAWVTAAVAWGVPGPLLGVVVATLFNQPTDSAIGFLHPFYPAATWIVQTARCFPVAVLILIPALASVPQAALDTAAVDGASSWVRLWRLALPLRRIPFEAGWLLCFVVAAGELSATILVYAPGTTVLSVRMLNLAHYGVDDRLAGIALFLYAAAVAAAAVLLLWHRIENTRHTSAL